MTIETIVENGHKINENFRKNNSCKTVVKKLGKSFSKKVIVDQIIDIWRKMVNHIENNDLKNYWRKVPKLY